MKNSIKISVNFYEVIQCLELFVVFLLIIISVSVKKLFSWVVFFNSKTKELLSRVFFNYSSPPYLGYKNVVDYLSTLGKIFMASSVRDFQ